MTTHPLPTAPAPTARTADDPAPVRAGAAFGLVAIVLIATGFALIAGADATITSGADRIAAFYAGANLPRTVAGGVLECLGYVLLLPFAAALAARLQGPGVGGTLLPSTARSALTVYVAISLAPGMAAGGAALWLAQRSTPAPQVLEALNALRGFSYFAALVPFAAFLVATGAAGLLTRRLPRWAGWSAVTIGVPLAATVPFATSQIPDVLGLLGLLWMVPVAVHLLRSAGTPIGHRG